MIVDFQHHFVPRELVDEADGGNVSLRLDASGAPRMTANAVLADLDEHIAMMDMSGIDVAVLTCPPAMCADLGLSRLANEKAKKAQSDYPGRFIGAAHVNPLGGADALNELDRCAASSDFKVRLSRRRSTACLSTIRDSNRSGIGSAATKCSFSSIPH